MDVLADEAGMYREEEFAEKFPGAYRVRSPEAVARAICEHLGTDLLRETVSALRWTASTHPPGTARHAQWTARADAIATLLEAGGIEP